MTKLHANFPISSFARVRFLSAPRLVPPPSKEKSQISLPDFNTPSLSLSLSCFVLVIHADGHFNQNSEWNGLSRDECSSLGTSPGLDIIIIVSLAGVLAAAVTPEQRPSRIVIRKCRIKQRMSVFAASDQMAPRCPSVQFPCLLLLLISDIQRDTRLRIDDRANCHFTSPVAKLRRRISYSTLVAK